MIRSRFAALAAGMFLSLVGMTAQSAQLIVNGGFEADGTGWTVSAPKVAFTDIVEYNACCSPFGTYAYGAAAAFFGDNDTAPGGTLFQNVVTIPGAMYTLTWAYGAISVMAPQKLLATVTDVGTSALLASGTSANVGTTNLTTMMDPNNLLTFMATGALTRITFKDTSLVTVSVDGVLDNVSLIGPAPIPEPSTYLLMLAGLGFVVYVARRRNTPGRAAA